MIKNSLKFSGRIQFQCGREWWAFSITGDQVIARKSLQVSGEPSRTRTCDPLVKSQLLYRLSYRPTLF